MIVNSGAIAEQFIGQHLLYMNESYIYPELFYWTREKSQSSAEVDYLLTKGQTIIPVEVKAGKTGSLRSIQVFMQKKGYKYALRFNTEPPSICNVTTSIAGPKHTFKLISLPLYLVEQCLRFIE